MSLELTYDKLRREIGNFLGYGRDPAVWVDSGSTLNAYKATDVAYILENGLRRFYWPMLPLQKYKDAEVKYERYIWSFLKPNATLTVLATQVTYDLPENFTDFASEGFNYATGAKKGRVARIDDDALLALQSQADRSGAPEYFSLRSKAAVDGLPPKYEVRFYPTPDDTYVLSYKYSLVPAELSAGNQYTLGGAQYSETILEACLAEAEKMLDDVEGLHEKRFRELLAASIEQDRKLANPDVIDVWPLEHPSDGLKVNKAYLKRLIGDAFGFGPHSAVWDSTQAQRVKLALETGLRKFYTPNILPGERYSHDWSFLKPVGRLSLVADKSVYDLPEDFAMFVGEDILFEPGENTIHQPIRLVGERQVTKLLQVGGSGRPEIAAWRTKALVQGAGTTYEVVFGRAPDQVYEVNFRYLVNPASLSEEAALPFGGQGNMQTIIEACLAAVEEARDAKQGIHSGLFLESLRASVSYDRRVNSPSSLGRLEPFGEAEHYSGRLGCGYNIVRYNGVSY